jgi:hypothetical protein
VAQRVLVLGAGNGVTQGGARESRHVYLGAISGGAEGAGCATARGMSWEVRYMVGSWDGGGIVESCNHGIIIIIIMAMFLVV